MHFIFLTIDPSTKSTKNRFAKGKFFVFQLLWKFIVEEITDTNNALLKLRVITKKTDKLLDFLLYEINVFSFILIVGKNIGVGFENSVLVLNEYIDRYGALSGINRRFWNFKSFKLWRLALTLNNLINKRWLILQ